MREQLSWRSYHYGLLGAVCGLLGWYLFSSVYQLSPALRKDSWVAVVCIRGAIFGGLMGFACSAYDGIRSFSGYLLLRKAAKGVPLGLIAGVPGFLLAEQLYRSTDVSASLRFALAIFCWASLAAVIALVESLNSGVEHWKAITGAIVGGTIGGSVYEYFGRPQSVAANSTVEQTWQAITFTILGTCIAAGISVISTILSDAWLEVVSGKLKGEKRSLSKFVDPVTGSKMAGILGSSPQNAHIYLPGDPDIASAHATVSFKNGAPTITILDEALQRRLPSTLNGRPVREFPLAPGDRIRLGNTDMVFHAKRGIKTGSR